MAVTGHLTLPITRLVFTRVPRTLCSRRSVHLSSNRDYWSVSRKCRRTADAVGWAVRLKLRGRNCFGDFLSTPTGEKNIMFNGKVGLWVVAVLLIAATGCAPIHAPWVPDNQLKQERSRSPELQQELRLRLAETQIDR